MPGGRGESFTKLHTAWMAELVARGASKSEWAVFCMIAQFQEPGPRGTVRAWRPVKEMAAVSGLSEKAVRNAVQGLKKKGVIRPIGKAHRSRAQLYEIMPGIAVSTGERVGNAHTHSQAKGMQVAHPNQKKGCATRSPKGMQVAHPNRREEPASPALRREGREKPTDRRRELRERLEGYGLH